MRDLSSIGVLRRAGFINPVRLISLLRATIDSLRLNLSGMTVLTEAASGPYVVTPVIAALAGAERTVAITRDSIYATALEVELQTAALANLCGINEKIDIKKSKTADFFQQADIITNLGFVRPLDAEVISILKPTAVIPLMCESWEIRREDVDLNACQSKKIPALGTNEEFPGFEVFRYAGLLCLKMLLEAQIEVLRSRIMVVSSDKFGKFIYDSLSQAGAKVDLVASLREDQKKELAICDALIIADYTRRDWIIGSDGDMTAFEVAKAAPGLTVIQYAGMLDISGLVNHDIVVYPNREIGPQRMAQTLADLGPRPVIELHAAGLKVGQIMAEARLRLGLGYLETMNYALQRSLCQAIQT